MKGTKQDEIRRFDFCFRDEVSGGTPAIVKIPELNFIDDKAGKSNKAPAKARNAAGPSSA